jgi:hypothetical protein
MGLYSNFQDNVSIIKPKKAKRPRRRRFAFLEALVFIPTRYLANQFFVAQLRRDRKKLVFYFRGQYNLEYFQDVRDA